MNPSPSSTPEDGRSVRLPSATDHSAEALARRRALLEQVGISTVQLAGESPEQAPEHLAGRIEGYVGHARVPVGVLGPLRIDGQEARGEFFVPLATTEGALVMSFQHVANMLARGDGIRTRCTDAMVWRSPAFRFGTMDAAARFAEALPELRAELEALVASGSRHCRLRVMESSIAGRDLYLRLGFETGDAAGQNMVTTATQAICTRLLDVVSEQPSRWQIEANFSGDKKATALTLVTTRGHRASAEVVLSDKLCRRYFRSGAVDLASAWRLAANGSLWSGALGSQANYANALAGLFIACGQDVACVAEAANGVTNAEVTDEGELYVSVSLPNLIVGTVGGGTRMPTARECLRMLGCEGEGRARAFAEVCAGVVLVGEIALIGAMAGGSFARAHTEAGERTRGER